MGACLFEGDFAGRTARSARDQFDSEAAETLARRLDEARAFGVASEGLCAKTPEFSARGGATGLQRLIGWLTVFGLAAGFIVDFSATLLVTEIVLGAIFGVIIFLRIMAALLSRVTRPNPPEPLSDRDLETITYLVPLKDEANVVASLIDAIGRIDYPSHKLDVKLLIEADDHRTMAAALAANPPSWFEILPVPPGDPRTKPKALNYGLHFARGSIVAILDAEDHPAKDQARVAAAALRHGGPDLAVVQAPLVIHNGRDGWLAGQFEVEYAIHFGLWLPLLARLGIPLPLGGTSNYFSRDWLEKAGGWDAWNVTEDADIGLRLARFGGRSATITPPTHEEAPADMKPWLHQRTRWMKGHLQTWLVLMREPFKAARAMGWGRFLATQLTFGGALLASIMHLPLFAFIAYSTATVSFETWHLMLFGLGYSSVVAAALFAKARHATAWTLATVPFYWILLSVAMLRALLHMKRKPTLWEKTPHGRPLSAQARQVVVTPPQQGDNVIQLPNASSMTRRERTELAAPLASCSRKAAAQAMSLAMEWMHHALGACGLAGADRVRRLEGRAAAQGQPESRNGYRGRS